MLALMEHSIKNGGDIPDEGVDLALMQAYSWSWDELQATPHYVRRNAWYRLQFIAEARADAERRQANA